MCSTVPYNCAHNLVKNNKFYFVVQDHIIQTNIRKDYYFHIQKPIKLIQFYLNKWDELRNNR